MVENPKKSVALQGSNVTVAPLDDGAFLFRAKQGDPEALTELIRRYTPLTRKLAASFAGVPESEREDLAQEGLIALHKAILLFDPEVSSFSTFAYLCVRRSMLSALKKFRRPAPTVSLEQLEEEPESPLCDPQDAVIDRENCDLLLQKCDAVLSEYENTVLKYHLSGFDIRKIAFILHKSEKSAENALTRARKKLGSLL